MLSGKVGRGEGPRMRSHFRYSGMMSTKSGGPFTHLSECACYSRYFENVKSCAFWGTWQLKHCFTESVAIGFVGSPPAHAWKPHPPVDAYFLESFTMSVMALRVAPCT